MGPGPGFCHGLGLFYGPILRPGLGLCLSSIPGFDLGLGLEWVLISTEKTHNNLASDLTILLVGVDGGYDWF